MFASYNGGPKISRLGHVTQVYVIFFSFLVCNRQESIKRAGRLCDGIVTLVN